MNRRYFFGAALGASLTNKVKAASTDTVNLGFIGQGGRGRSLVRSFQKLPTARIAWLCDPDQARLERAAQDAGGTPKQTNDMRRMLEDKDLHAVVVATPDHWHAPAMLLACEAGKDVYAEKPASHNVREGRLMVDTARRTKRVVQFGTQRRSLPPVIEGIEFVRSGKIGKVLMAKAWNIQLRKDIGRKPDSAPPPGFDYDTWVGPALMMPFNENRHHYNWHWHWNFGTGDAGNDGAHQIDLARWAMGAGMPVRASGMGRKVFFEDDQQTPDTMNVTFDYADGRSLIWEMRIWTPYGMEGIQNGVAVYGTEGMVHIGEIDDGPWGYRVFDRKGKVVKTVAQGGGEPHYQNFLDCIRSRKAPTSTIEEGHITTTHCHLANIVARVGRNVAFDPVKETIADDPAASKLLAREYRSHWGKPKGA